MLPLKPDFNVSKVQSDKLNLHTYYLNCLVIYSVVGSLALIDFDNCSKYYHRIIVLGTR